MVVFMVTFRPLKRVTIKRIIMAIIIKPLTDTQIKNAKPKDKDYKLSDGGGMYVIVRPNGSKWWRLNYRYNSKQKTLSLGVYPDVSLAEARELREEYRKLLRDGIDPSSTRQEAKESSTTTFKEIANQWFLLNEQRLSRSYVQSVTGYLANHINPYIGDRDIATLHSSDIVALAKIMEQKEILETLRRVLNLLSSIFKYAVGIGAMKHNIIADVDRKNTFKRAPKRNYPTIIDSKLLGELLCAIENYHGNVVTKYALLFIAHTFVRPANIRFAKWSEIDLEAKIWRIPSEKMKSSRAHIVPLSSQALEILHNTHAITGGSKYIFPSSMSNSRAMSENTMLQALRRLDYTKDEIVVHSFRGIASTILHENIPAHNIHSDAIERQLAHSDKNSVKAAYNHAEYLKERIELMQWYSNYLESLL